MDYITEAEAMSLNYDWDDYDDFDNEIEDTVPVEIEDFEALGFRDNYLNTRYGKEEVRKAREKARKSTGDTQRYRCMVKGCNPVLFGEHAVAQHKADTGHTKIYKWPVRSEAGKRKQRERNRNGYYGKYNFGKVDYR